MTKVLRQMLYKPCEEEEVFEVSFYNKHVRSLAEKNQGHEISKDHWADRQKHHLNASDEVEARRVVSERFKSDDGFVIEGVLLPAF